MEKCSCKLNSSQKLAEVDMIDNNFSRKVGKNIYFEKILIFFFLCGEDKTNLNHFHYIHKFIFISVSLWKTREGGGKIKQCKPALISPTHESVHGRAGQSADDSNNPHNLCPQYMDFHHSNDFLDNYAQCGNFHTPARGRVATWLDFTQDRVLCAHLEPCRVVQRRQIWACIHFVLWCWAAVDLPFISCDGEKNHMEPRCHDPAGRH